MKLRIVVAAAAAAIVMSGLAIGSATAAETTSATAAVTCHITDDKSKTFTFEGTIFNGTGTAGFYSGVTTSPSKTQVTSAGFEAQCLLAHFGNYNPGTIDGEFGPNSQAAMKQLCLFSYWS